MNIHTSELYVEPIDQNSVNTHTKTRDILFNKNETIKKRNTQVDRKENNNTRRKRTWQEKECVFHDKFEEDKCLYFSAL
jgi:hypothetical protein